MKNIAPKDHDQNFKEKRNKEIFKKILSLGLITLLSAHFLSFNFAENGLLGASLPQKPIQCANEKEIYKKYIVQ